MATDHITMKLKTVTCFFLLFFVGLSIGQHVNPAIRWLPCSFGDTFCNYKIFPRTFGWTFSQNKDHAVLLKLGSLISDKLHSSFAQFCISFKYAIRGEESVLKLLHRKNKCLSYTCPFAPDVTLLEVNGEKITEKKPFEEKDWKSARFSIDVERLYFQFEFYGFQKNALFFPDDSLSNVGLKDIDVVNGRCA